MPLADSHHRHHHFLKALGYCFLISEVIIFGFLWDILRSNVVYETFWIVRKIASLISSKKY
jgi:hypothetical protein